MNIRDSSRLWRSYFDYVERVHGAAAAREERDRIKPYLETVAAVESATHMLSDQRRLLRAGAPVDPES